MSLNSVCLSGNLTRDPELRQTQGGNSILSFGVAVNDRRRNQQTGEWEDYANFVDCVIFGNRADALNRIMAKGMKVAITGRLHYSSWEREGQRRSKIEVYADNVEIMSQRKQDQPAQQPYQPMAQQPYRPQAQQQPSQAYQQVQQQYGQQQMPPQAPMQQAPQMQAPQLDVYQEDIPF